MFYKIRRTKLKESKNLTLCTHLGLKKEKTFSKNENVEELVDSQDHNSLGMSEHCGRNLNEEIPLQNSKIFKIFKFDSNIHICPTFTVYLYTYTINATKCIMPVPQTIFVCFTLFILTYTVKRPKFDTLFGENIFFF
jgi:hypothetical protein